MKERLGLPAGDVAPTRPGKKSEEFERLILSIILSGKILVMLIDSNIVYCCSPNSRDQHGVKESF